MKLEKAIEELNRVDNRVNIICYAEFREAVKLGIEALKAWKALREGRAGAYEPRLPSETKE